MPDPNQNQDHQSPGLSMAELLNQQAMEAAAFRIAQLEAENTMLRSSVECAKQLVNAKDHAIIAMDLDGRITSWNSGASAILGYADADLLGQSGDMLFLPEDRVRGLFLEKMCWAVEEGYALNERWHLRCDGSRFWASGSMTPLLDAAGRPHGFLNVFRDNTALHTQNEHHFLLMAEMSHRLKNAFSTMQAVALQTLRSGGVAKETQDTFEARLIALARSYELLTGSSGTGAALTKVLERMLQPYDDGKRIQLKGPPVWLPANAVEPVGLAFHELATNAAKYGALSVQDGRIDVSWCMDIAANGARLAYILWREQGGPKVVMPAHYGFGSRLLEQGMVQDLGGTLKVAFRPDGLECSICLPVVPAQQKIA